MKFLMASRICGIILALFLCSLAGKLLAEGQGVRHILVLHSYNQGYAWSDAETRGILDAFKDSGKQVEFHITYMDAKRIRSKETDLLLSRTLAINMETYRFAGAILCDNDALEFAREHRDGILKGVPIVFCGINNFTSDMVEDWKDCTGVIENQDYLGSCEIGLRLFPSASNVFVISDSSLTGKAHFDGVSKIAPQLPAKVTYWNFSEHTLDETLRELRALGPENIILLLSFFKDGAGVTYSMEDAIARIMESTRCPVFTANDTRIKSGVMGGKVLTGFDQGRIAGTLMLRILSGTPASDIGIVTDPPNRYTFDYNALARHKVSMSSLPKESRVMNSPVPFYYVNKPLFFTIIVSLVILAILVVALISNIIRRKIKERDLKESEEKFRTLFEQAAVGVGQADIRGSLIRVNGKYAGMLGYAPEEMLGRNFTGFAYPEDSEKLLEQSQKLLKGEISDFTMEGRCVHKNGHPVWVMLNVSLLRLNGGRDVYQIPIVQDLTEKKRLEELLIRSEKLSAVGQLVTGISHEFNNVLMIIRGNLEILAMEKSAGSGGGEMIEVLQRQVDRGRDIVSGVMAFAKPKPARKTYFRLGEMIREVVSLQAEQIKIENIQAEVDIPENLEIFADRDQMQQVALNMVINSRHAIHPKGSGKIRFSAERFDGGVKLHISDDGIGMSNETQKKIFTPFFTTKGAMAENGQNIKGSGLGLSVCNNIVQMHGGNISFESREGAGSIFTIYLPDAKEVVSTEMEEVQGQNAQGEFSALKVMVVDDEPQICTFLPKMIGFLGCGNVRATTSPFDALKIVDEDTPDIMFLDVMMPGISGKQVARQIREKHKNVFIVLMSGKLDLDLDEIKALGASAFMQKPFGKKEILDILRQAKSRP